MNKVLRIFTIIIQSLATTLFICSMFWVVYFIIYIPDYFSDKDWSGIGLVASYLMYIIHIVIGVVLSITTIILSIICKKKNDNHLGNICLFSNIGHISLYAVFLIMMFVVIAMK